MEVFIFFVLFVAFAGSLALFWQSGGDERYVERESHSDFGIGTYIAGLPSDRGACGCECMVTSSNFVFIGSFGKKLGTIPRDSINEVIVEDKTTMHQRVTATRILALGIFALAAPKKIVEKEFCLLVDWDGEHGIRQNTLFTFSGPSGLKEANHAASSLRQACLPKATAIRPDERICPFCAETIKKDAKICRYCQRELAW